MAVNVAIYEYPDGTLQVEGIDNRFVYAIAVIDPGCPDAYVILDPALAAGDLALAWGDPELPGWLDGGPPLDAVIDALLDLGYPCYRGWVGPDGEVILPEAVR